MQGDSVAGKDAMVLKEKTSSNGKRSKTAVSSRDRLKAVETKCSASLRIVTPATSSFVVAMSTFRMVLKYASGNSKGNLVIGYNEVEGGCGGGSAREAGRTI
jgi:hypothetical protein